MNSIHLSWIGSKLEALLLLHLCFQLRTKIPGKDGHISSEVAGKPGRTGLTRSTIIMTGLLNLP